MEAQLPVTVLHRGGHDDFKTEVDFSVPLGHVPETGGDDRGVQDIGSHHFPGVVILDGFHYQEFFSVRIADGQGIPAGNRDDSALLFDFVAGQGEDGR